MAHFVMFLALLPRNFQHLFLGCRCRGSSINVGPSSAISDVTIASTVEAFFVGSTLPSTYSVTFARIVPGYRGNFLVVSDL